MVRPRKWATVWLPLAFLVLGPVDGSPARAGLTDLLNQAASVVNGQGAAELSTADIVRGLKEALHIGAANAVQQVAVRDGFYGNPQIRIPLPSAVERVAPLLRAAGYGEQVDAFRQSLNRAAEAAAPEAKALLWDAVRQMSFEDARRILNGRENEATLYLEDKTAARLAERFTPLVHDSMQSVGVTRRYQELEATVKRVPFANLGLVDLDQYVTQGALGGVFHVLGQEEARIRRDPAARVTDLLRRVFESP